MKQFKFKAVYTGLTLAVLASVAYAQSSDVITQQSARQVDQLRAATEALLNDFKSRLANLETCHAQKKFWNGSACEGSEATLNNPTVVTRTETVPDNGTKAFGAGGSSCYVVCMYSCPSGMNPVLGSPDIFSNLSYEVDSGTNTINIINRQCVKRLDNLLLHDKQCGGNSYNNMSAQNGQPC
jgi:hypothetical protein